MQHREKGTAEMALVRVKDKTGREFSVGEQFAKRHSAELTVVSDGDGNPISGTIAAGRAKPVVPAKTRTDKSGKPTEKKTSGNAGGK